MPHKDSQHTTMALLVCDWELAEAQKKDAIGRARVRGEEPAAELLAEERGLHCSVEPDVKRLLQGKTHAELEALQERSEMPPDAYCVTKGAATSPDQKPGPVPFFAAGISSITILKLMLLKERKRMAVKEEQQRRMQEVMASKPAPSKDNFEMKAMKSMGAMEDGDAMFGSGAEVNLDSQVSCLGYLYNSANPYTHTHTHTNPYHIPAILLITNSI
ncbi:Cactin protein [Spatholobus suberectus]|nr:Cactin protein [Spatholobus suberectus]